MTDTCTMLGVKDICISLGVKKEDKRAVTFGVTDTCTMLGVKDICISLHSQSEERYLYRSKEQ